jgi:hypothetical protein
MTPVSSWIKLGLLTPLWLKQVEIVLSLIGVSYDCKRKCTEDTVHRLAMYM